MPIPLQISFRNMDPSPAVEARIRKKAEKLERFHDRIIGCTVVVDALVQTTPRSRRSSRVVRVQFGLRSAAGAPKTIACTCPDAV